VGPGQVPASPDRALWFFVWAAIADNPLLPFNDAVNDTVSEKRWIFLLAALELIRQVHYFISERSAAYHRFWTQRVFGGSTAGARA